MHQPDPVKEKMRLEVLRKYEILDTPPDGSLNKMTEMASRIFNVPIAIVSLVDEDRVWFKSRHGLDVEEVGTEPGLCASAIISDEVYVVEDARKDPRTLTNPLVAGEFGLQFYAAAPLRTEDGFNLGTFCVIDTKQRFFSEEQRQVLKDFADLTMDWINLRMEARNLVKDTLTIKESQN